MYHVFQTFTIKMAEDGVKILLEIVWDAAGIILCREEVVDFLNAVLRNVSYILRDFMRVFAIGIHTASQEFSAGGPDTTMLGIVILVGVLGVFVLSLVLRTLRYNDVRHYVILQSIISGNVRVHERPGLYILRPWEFVRSFDLRAIGGERDRVRGEPSCVATFEGVDGNYISSFSKAPMRIDPPAWTIYSQNGEAVSFDAWLMLTIKDPLKFLVDTTSSNPFSVLLERLRQCAVDLAKDMTIDDIRHHLAERMARAEFLARFGVEVEITVDKIAQSAEVMKQRTLDLQAAEKRRAEHTREMEEVAHRIRMVEREEAVALRDIEKQRTLAAATSDAAAEADRMRHMREEAENAHKIGMQRAASAVVWDECAAAIRAGRTADEFFRLKQLDVQREVAMHAKFAMLPPNMHVFSNGLPQMN